MLNRLESVHFDENSDQMLWMSLKPFPNSRLWIEMAVARC